MTGPVHLLTRLADTVGGPLGKGLTDTTSNLGSTASKATSGIGQTLGDSTKALGSGDIRGVASGATGGVGSEHTLSFEHEVDTDTSQTLSEELEAASAIQ